MWWSGSLGARPRYMRAVSNTGFMPWDSASAMASRFGSGVSRRTVGAAVTRDESIEQGRRDLRSFGEQRADLVALAAGADRAVAADVACLAPGDGDVAVGGHPAGEKGFAPGAEDDAVPRDEVGRCFGYVDEWAAGRPLRVGDSAMADVAVGEHEAGLGVVLLLIDDAVETDGAVAKTSNACVPDLRPVLAPTMVRVGDVKAEEAEVTVVRHYGDGGDGVLAEPADQEAARIGIVEGVGIQMAGIPALSRRPVEQDVQVPARGRPDRQRFHWSTVAPLQDGPLKRHSLREAGRPRQAPT
jgi:hypothetical protein